MTNLAFATYPLPLYILPVQGVTTLPFNIDAGFARSQGATQTATQAATLPYLPATRPNQFKGVRYANVFFFLCFDLIHLFCIAFLVSEEPFNRFPLAGGEFFRAFCGSPDSL